MRSNSLRHCSQHLPFQIISRHSKSLLLYLKHQHHHGQFWTQKSSTTGISETGTNSCAPLTNKKIATYSTPVTPTPEPPTNSGLPAPMAIPYNESELSPPSPPMFNYFQPSTQWYPTRAGNQKRHLVDCVLQEHTVNMCMRPEMVESAIRPLWSLQYSATHQPTTHCMYNVMNE